MIRKSKSLVLIAISFLIFFGFIFQSCEKEEFDYELNIPEEYNEVGKLHNQGLNFIFRKIKKESIALMQENETSTLKNARVLDYQALVSEGTLEFCKTNKKLKDNYQICENSLNIFKPKLKSTGLKTMDTGNLSARQVDLVNQISKSLEMNNSKKGIDKLKKDLDKINRAALVDLTKEEAAVIFCATSTAYSSAQYWIKNHKKWYFLLHYPEILDKYKEEELNNLQLKNDSLALKSSTIDDSWWSDTWNSVEDWWDGATDDVSDWWEEDGQNLAATDAAGAVTGAMVGAYVAPATMGSSIVTGAVSTGLSASAGYCVYIYLSND